MATYMYANRSDNVQVGPISMDELKDLWASNTINASTLVWTVGMANWQPIADTKAVMDQIQPAPQEAPVMPPPPRPVPPSEAGKDANFLASITNRKSDLKPAAGFLAGISGQKRELKHVEPTPAAQPLSGGNQGGMMAAIMARGAQLNHVDTDKNGIAKQAALSRNHGGADANAHAALLQATSDDKQPRPRTRTKSNFRKSVFEGATLKKGWLQKRSTGSMQRWQKRYFVLAGHYLKYANTPEDLDKQENAKVKSAIDLTGTKTVICSSREITVHVGTTVVELQAATPDIAQSWKEVLSTFVPDRAALAKKSLSFAKSKGAIGLVKSKNVNFSPKGADTSQAQVNDADNWAEEHIEGSTSPNRRSSLVGRRNRTHTHGEYFVDYIHDVHKEKFVEDSNQIKGVTEDDNAAEGRARAGTLSVDNQMQWMELQTPEGVPYYRNKQSGELTWDRPRELGNAEEDEAELDGEWIWFLHTEHGWIPGRVTQRFVGAVEVETQTGEKKRVKLKGKEMGLPIDNMRSLGKGAAYNDLVQMEQVHEASILDALRRRFLQSKIYTEVGDILVSINPFKLLPLYTPQVVETYREKASRGTLASLPPHVFTIAANAHRNLVDSDRDQAILISGESGAGKTEATKQCLQYLSVSASSQSPKINGNDSDDVSAGIEQKILAANPILEGFGNAKTVRNNNSSRFGKFMQVFISPSQGIMGCATISYLLEKSRVVAQSTAERNYHIFYQLCEAAQTRIEYADGGSHTNHLHSQSVDLHLCPASAYLYLNRSECLTIEGVDDFHQHEDLQHAMDGLNLKQGDASSMFEVCATILHLGNIVFDSQSSGDGSVIRPGVKPDIEEAMRSKGEEALPAVQLAAKLLKVDHEALAKQLCYNKKTIRGEAIFQDLNPEQASHSRDALSKALYGRTFNWLVSRLNELMATSLSSEFSKTDSQSKKMQVIGVLDIFGFEIFKINSFEQLCINYANEKLQQQFNVHTFKTEEAEYKVQEVEYAAVTYIDNQDVLDLIECKKPPGIFALMEDEIYMPRATDLTLLQKMTKSFTGATVFGQSRNSGADRFSQPLGNEGREAFTIAHYAGPVLYQISGFLEKNKDQLYEDLSSFLQHDSQNMFVSKILFAPGPSTAESALGGRGKKGKLRAESQATKFSNQLGALMQTLAKSDPHYIRCIKPNPQKLPEKVHGYEVLEQLRCSGIFEAVQIRQSGYPFRMTHSAFYTKYRPIARLPYLKRDADSKAACTNLVEHLKQLPSLGDVIQGCKLGKTKVLWRSVQDRPLSLALAVLMEESVIKIQTQARRFAGRCLFIRMQKLQPVLSAVLQARSLPEIEAALVGEARNLRCSGRPVTMRVMVQLREVAILLREQHRLTELLKQMVQRTPDRIDDEMEIAYTEALAAEMADDPLLVKTKQMLDSVEDRRQALKDLREQVSKTKQYVLRKRVEAVLATAVALKSTYGEYCVAEETAVKKLLEHLDMEEKLVAELETALLDSAMCVPVDRQDAEGEAGKGNGNKNDATSNLLGITLDTLEDAITKTEALGLKTRTAEASVGLAKLSLRLRTAVRAAMTMSGQGTRLSSALAGHQSLAPPRLRSAESFRVRSASLNSPATAVSVVGAASLDQEEAWAALDALLREGKESLEILQPAVGADVASQEDDDSVDVSPTLHRGISDEFKLAREVRIATQAVIERLHAACKPQYPINADLEFALEQAKQLSYRYGAQPIVDLLVSESTLLLQRLKHMALLLSKMEGLCPVSRIEGTDADSIKNEVTSQLDTDDLDKAISEVDGYNLANDKILWRLLDGSDEVDACRFLSKLRNAVKIAMSMSAANSDVAGTIRSWQEVEGALVEGALCRRSWKIIVSDAAASRVSESEDISAQQRRQRMHRTEVVDLAEVGQVEVTLVEDLTALHGSAPTVLAKLKEAISVLDDASLEHYLTQARKLRLDTHKDPGVQGQVQYAQQMYDYIINTIKACEEALEILQLPKLDYALSMATALKLQNPLVTQVIQTRSKISHAQSLVDKAMDGWDQQPMAEATECCDGLTYVPEHLEEMRTLVQMPTDKFLENRLQAAVEGGQQEKVLKITLRIKEYMLEESGDDFFLPRFDGLRNGEEYATAGMGTFDSDKKKRELHSGMLRYTEDQNGIPTTLTLIEDPAKVKAALTLFKNVQGFMGDRNVMYPTMVAQEILRQGLQDRQIGDEVYVQLMKQLTQNWKGIGVEKGWELMELCLSTFPPSDKLENFLGKFLQQAGQRDCLFKLTSVTSVITQHTQVPALEKIHALRKHVTAGPSKKPGKVKAGWLYKKGTLGSKKMWFVLDTGKSWFMYFKEEVTTDDPVVHWELFDIISVKVKREKANAKQFPFEVATKQQGNIVLAADSDPVRMSWVQTLKKSQKKMDL